MKLRYWERVAGLVTASKPMSLGLGWWRELWKISRSFRAAAVMAKNCSHIVASSAVPCYEEIWRTDVPD